jgi:hypothetical protein
MEEGCHVQAGISSDFWFTTKYQGHSCTHRSYNLCLQSRHIKANTVVLKLDGDVGSYQSL